jgi:hypothetical protein
MKPLKLYLIATAAAVSLSAAATYAQSSADQHEHTAPPTGQAATANNQMMANMQAEQAKLDDLVAQMNAATGPDKVDKIAAAVTEMAAMHKRMSGMMMMRGGMMK